MLDYLLTSEIHDSKKRIYVTKEHVIWKRVNDFQIIPLKNVDAIRYENKTKYSFLVYSIVAFLLTALSAILAEEYRSNQEEYFGYGGFFLLIGLILLSFFIRSIKRKYEVISSNSIISVSLNNKNASEITKEITDNIKLLETK